ncbi:MAG: hypothetical protein ACFFE2_12380 [Candidatus Thorarchaeota archaeon]
MNQVSDAETAEIVWKRFYRIGVVAALSIVALLLIGIIGIISSSLQSTTNNDWFAQIQNNWLVVLFKLNAGFSGVQQDLLMTIDLLDIVIMILVGIVFIPLYAVLRNTSRIWSLIAALLPFVGIPIFLVTATAGRSNLLIGGLIISVIMLRSNIFSKVTSYIGIVASSLLFFTGDIATAIFTSSSIVAMFIAVGYVLWMTWFLLIAQRIFQLGHSVSEDSVKRN